jgi:hypothetical protein
MQGPRAKLSKGEIVALNSSTMATMASRFSSTSDGYDAFLLGKMYINCKKENKVKISNLKMVKNSGVTLKEEFKNKIYGYFRIIVSMLM